MFRNINPRSANQSELCKAEGKKGRRRRRRKEETLSSQKLVRK
jgi:hypothetical protein